jgi:hypothetical protein
MNRAITFCAIALGIPAVTYAAVESYMSGRAMLGVHAVNGLECTIEKDELLTEPSLDGSHTSTGSSNIRHIEFLHNSKFRVVDESATNDVLANDYIGAMTTTDTTYTFGEQQNRISAKNPNDVIRNDFSGLAVDRLATKLYGHYMDGTPGSVLYMAVTITGWCTPAYIPPRPIPKKL